MGAIQSTLNTPEGRLATYEELTAYFNASLSQSTKDETKQDLKGYPFLMLYPPSPISSKIFGKRTNLQGDTTESDTTPPTKKAKGTVELLTQLHRWTSVEDQALIEVVRELFEQGKTHKESGWEEAAAAMKLRGYEKTRLACRNRWGRKLRVQTGLDERKPRAVKRSMVTGVYSPSHRKEAFEKKKKAARKAAEGNQDVKDDGGFGGIKG